MITFLASPKPFNGIAKEHQYRAIRSWQGAGQDVEVILYGDSAGIDKAGGDLGVQVVKQIACAPSGVPYFGAIAGHAAEHGKHDLQVYLNCDILLSGILPAMRRIGFPQFLLIGQRIDLGEGLFVDVAQEGWMRQLTQWAAAGKAKLHGPTGIDYFGFRRGMWQGLPTVVIGRGGYDGALLAHCIRNRIRIVDATFAVTALHQFHDYEHIRGGLTAVIRGSDARHNISQAGGPRSSTLVSDAGYTLKNSLAAPLPRRGDPLRRLELKLRYELGWPNTALALRLIWRGLHVLGITRVPRLSLAEVFRAEAKSDNLAK